MFGRSILAVGAAMLPAALAQVSCTGSASAGGFSNINGFTEPRSCVPIGYFSAQDLGQIGPAALTSYCQNQCNTYGIVCQAFVGQVWFAADSGLSTGQCFYYTTPPTGPRYCVDSPGAIVGQTKGGSIQQNPIVSCLSASPAAASPFCSAFVTAAPAGSSTTTTVTSTPTVVITSATTTASGTFTFITAALTTTTTTVTTTVTVGTTATTGTTTSTLSIATTSNTFPTLSSTTTAAAKVKRAEITATRYAHIRYSSDKLKRGLKARQAVIPPACFPGGSSGSDVTSACACIGVTPGVAPVPVTVTSTAVASATTQTVLTATSIAVSTATGTSSGTITSTATSVTLFTTGTVTTTTTTTVTVTGTAIASNSCADCYPCTSDSQCRDGFECAYYLGGLMDQYNLCSNSDPNGVDYTCASVCTNTVTLSTPTPAP